MGLGFPKQERLILSLPGRFPARGSSAAARRSRSRRAHCRARQPGCNDLALNGCSGCSRSRADSSAGISSTTRRTQLACSLSCAVQRVKTRHSRGLSETRVNGSSKLAVGRVAPGCCAIWMRDAKIQCPGRRTVIITRHRILGRRQQRPEFWVSADCSHLGAKSNSRHAGRRD